MSGSLQRREFAAMTIHEITDHVRDPDRMSGGGTVAAIAAAAAASLAELVFTLSARRKSNRRDLATLNETIEQLANLQRSFLVAADTDAETLKELMSVYRTRRTQAQITYADALFNASKEPLKLATGILELLELIDSQLYLASRFTVADLGAAASVAAGSVTAALFMTEINAALLRDLSASQSARAEALETEAAAVELRARQIASSIEDSTRLHIHGKREYRS